MVAESAKMQKLENRSIMSNNARQKNEESTAIFPVEIVIEILSWLPLKALSRAQLVCKEWRTAIQDHHFLEQHMSRSPASYKFYNVAVSPSAQPEAEREPADTFSYICGCDGLLLMRNNVSKKCFIWNPAIFRVLELPDPHDWNSMFALSYIGATRSYRIVSIYKDKKSGGHGWEVATPGHSMTWRRLALPDHFVVNASPEEKFSVVSAGGAVHFVRVSNVAAEIVTLDLETECFTMNHLPGGLFCGMHKVWELDWDGKLAFADILGQNLELMELEDHKKQRWCGKKKVVPLPFLKDIGVEGNDVFPLFIKEGEIWFWLKNKKIIVYMIEAGKTTDKKVSESFFFHDKLYIYKPSLVSFEGMQPDTVVQNYRPRFLLD